MKTCKEALKTSYMEAVTDKPRMLLSSRYQSAQEEHSLTSSSSSSSGSSSSSSEDSSDSSSMTTITRGGGRRYRKKKPSPPTKGVIRCASISGKSMEISFRQKCSGRRSNNLFKPRHLYLMNDDNSSSMSSLSCLESESDEESLDDLPGWGSCESRRF
jgi:hypothetical protein